MRKIKHAARADHWSHSLRPQFLTGEMTLGELTQAAAAFTLVQVSFNWLVDDGLNHGTPATRPEQTAMSLRAVAPL